MKFPGTATILFSAFACAAGAASAAPYQQSKTGVCGTASTCTITFANVPSGKTAELTNVSCYISGPFGTEIKKVQLQQLSSSNAPGVSVTLVAAPYLIGTSSPNATFIGMINQQVTLYATAGQKFRVRTDIQGGRFSEFSCHISGKI
jgi:hypothetical protein